jgi:hypothetical protein
LSFQAATQVAGEITGWVDLMELDLPGLLSLADTVQVSRDPTIPFEVATKNYVDNVVQNLRDYVDAQVSTLYNYIDTEISDIVNNSVWSFNGRRGNVLLTLTDVTDVGGAPLSGPAFTGVATSSLPPYADDSNRIATTEWVNTEVAAALVEFGNTQMVTSFNGRHNDVVLQLSDITGAGGAPTNNAVFTGFTQMGQVQTGQLNCATPSPSDYSNRAATTEWVRLRLNELSGSLPGTFVTSWRGRTGHVVLTLDDVTDVGGAPIHSPDFTGTPRAITPPANDDSTRLATTAFIKHAISELGSEIEYELDRVIHVGPSPPPNPHQGMLWWDSRYGEDHGGALYLWFVDQDSGQWVDASPSEPGPQGPPGDMLVPVSYQDPEPEVVGKVWWNPEQRLFSIFAPARFGEEKWRAIAGGRSTWVPGGLYEAEPGDTMILVWTNTEPAEIVLPHPSELPQGWTVTVALAGYPTHPLTIRTAGGVGFTAARPIDPDRIVYRPVPVSSNWEANQRVWTFRCVGDFQEFGSNQWAIISGDDRGIEDGSNAPEGNIGEYFFANDSVEMEAGINDYETFFNLPRGDWDAQFTVSFWGSIISFGVFVAQTFGPGQETTPPNVGWRDDNISNAIGSRVYPRFRINKTGDDPFGVRVGGSIADGPNFVTVALSARRMR